MTTTIDLHAISDQELADLQQQIGQERASRASLTQKEDVVLTFDLNAGNKRAGAKCWVKRIKDIDPSKCNGYGLTGDWVDKEQDSLPEGTYIVIGGSGGSHKNTTSHYILARVRKGATIHDQAGYQEFIVEGAEYITGSDQTVDKQAAVADYPDLAGAVKGKLFTIYYALKQCGF